MNIRNLFSMKGRCSRSTFWMTMLPIFFIALYFYFVLSGFSSNPDFGTGGLSWLSRLFSTVVQLTILMIVGTLCVIIVFLHVKRLHDLGMPGWFFWLQYIPLIGVIITLLIYFKKGTDGDNQYGPDPT